LLRGLVTSDHPLPDLPWDVAERTFYRTVDAGLDAAPDWVDAAGERTDDPERVYRELFAYARRGLTDAGVDSATADEFLRPIERRYETGRTPSRWKKAAVRVRLERGESLPEAIVGMQREYYDHAGGDPVVEWPWPDGDGRR
jgi:hypothetical protein